MCGISGDAVCRGRHLSAQESSESRAGLLLVANKGDRTLSLIDSKTNKQIAAVPEDGVTGHEVAASADGKRAFVPIFGNSGVGKPGTDGQLIRVIDLAKREIVGPSISAAACVRIVRLRARRPGSFT